MGREGRRASGSSVPIKSFLEAHVAGGGRGGGRESGSEVAPVRMTAWQLWLVYHDNDFSTVAP